MVRRIAAFAVTAAALIPVFGNDAAPAATSLPRVGTLDRFAADSVAAIGTNIKDTGTETSGTLVSVFAANQLWQIYPDNSLGTTFAAVRDATTLKIVKTLDLGLTLQRSASSANGGDWLHAIDGDRRIFFLSNNVPPGVGPNRATWTTLEVDLRTFALRQLVLGPPIVVADRAAPQIRPAAMEYDPTGDAVIMLFGGIAASGFANNITVLYRLDLNGKPHGSRTIRACNGSLTPTDLASTSQLAGLVTAENLYFSCQRAGSIGAVVRIDRDHLLDPDAEDEIVAGPAYLETAFADPGSGRIFLITIAGEIWAFDTARMAFVGVVAGGTEGSSRPSIGFGLDQATGQLFLQSPILGLGIAEGRFSPIPQARSYPSMQAAGQERLISHAKTRRLYVLTGAGSTNDRSETYMIYDIGEAPIPSPPPDPDANTRDMPEQPGVTESRYFASGTGYGVRVLLAKGVSAVPPQPTSGQQAPVADVIAKNLNSKCGFTDRELVAGRVAKAEYDTGSTAAEAVGVDVDERTKLDAEHVSRCDVQAQNGNNRFDGIFTLFATAPEQSESESEMRDRLRSECAAGQQAVGSELGLPGADERECDSGQSWQTQNAYCSSSFGESVGRLKSKNEEPSVGTVACPAPGGRLAAQATGYLTSNGYASVGFEVGKAHTTSEVSREATGVVSTVVSEAQDINIAGVIRIGEITATARSRSNGRPVDGKMSSHVYTIKGVVLTNPITKTSTVLCDEYDSRQGKRNCDIEGTIKTLNLAANGKAEFRLASGIDAERLEGSEKGALTAVQKSPERQASDQALVGDRTSEVPVLEMTVYNDNVAFGRARQIYQFAGVSTAATYNIVPLPSGAGFGDDIADDGFDEGLLSPDGMGGDGLSGGNGNFGGAPAASIGGTVGSILSRALKALVRGIRMFFTSPRHALLLFTAWALFSLPPVLARRRRLLATARSDF